MMLHSVEIEHKYQAYIRGIGGWGYAYHRYEGSGSYYIVYVVNLFQQE